MSKRILLIGGPSTGKTSIINHLQSLGYPCMVEISREVIKNAQNQGIDQLFLEQPVLFSTLLKDARIAQFNDANTHDNAYVFFDRGIPDTVAYLNYVAQEYPQEFITACEEHRYDLVFLFPPWEEIHTTDNERYESFEQAQAIHSALINTYRKYNYLPIAVPTGTVEMRTQFIISKLK